MKQPSPRSAAGAPPAPHLLRPLSIVLLVIVELSSCRNAYTPQAQAATEFPPVAGLSPPALVQGPIVTEREPNQQVLQYVWQFTNRAGELELSTNTVVELAAGLNRYDPQSGGYVPCRAEWELTRDGYCLARQTQHQVILDRELAAAGAVDCLTLDGVRLRSTLRGVALVDAHSGRSVWLAEVQSVQPELVSPGEVVYRDGCTGLLRCDVRYRLGLDVFEQEVLLKEQVPEDVLAAAGIAAQQARLVVLTEFFDPPPPVKRAREVVGSSGQRVKDQELQFGAMSVRRGLAFALEAEPLVAAVPVAKNWEELEGRPFLIESVGWTDLAPLLRNLPLPGQARTRSAKDQAPRSAAVTRRPGLPPLPRGAQSRVETARRPLFRNGRLVVAPERVRQARVHMPARARNLAVVLDYPLQITSAQSNYTFQADKTYYISGTVTLTGTTKLEGGAVLKYAPDATLDVHGPLECLTGPYRPVVLTAKLDNTVGESVTNGTPSGYYANPALRIDSEVGAPPCVLTNLRVAWADRAIVFETGSNHFVAHAQFVNCREALCPYTAEVRVWNVLFANTVNVTDGILPATVHGAHWTVDGATALNYGTNATLYLTNSLVVAVTGQTNFTGTGTVVLTNASGVFQAVGAGAHYLPAGSPYRNCGTTNIPADLAAALKTLTTYPPLVRTNPFALDVVLGPTARRDKDGLPALGWHYDPVDWCWTGLAVGGTNEPATLLLTNGVVVATYGDTGITLEDTGRLMAEGTPTNAVRLLRYNAVQEQSTNWGNAVYEPAVLAGPAHSPGTNSPWASLRFVNLSALGGYGYHVYTSSGWSQLLSLTLRDCALRGGKAQFGANWQVWNGSGYDTPVINLNDNLFERVVVDFKYGPQFSAYNNLFWGGTDTFAKWDVTNTWQFYDNAFHGATLVTNGTAAIANGYNAYIPTNVVRLPGGSNDKPLASFAYAAGFLGNYYHGGTEFVGAGSRGAGTAALYHYTTQTNQTKETTSTVDIGLHYVACTNGVPLDTDADGLPDYYEDANGNGTVDSGEASWTNAVTNPNPYGYNDLQCLEATGNFLVNDPQHDYANEQNSQWQPGVVVLGDTVIVGFWDSNQGVYALGSYTGYQGHTNTNPPVATSPVRMAAYSVSIDGGRTFADMGVPPLPAGATNGDAGDPVLALDRTANTVYYAATSERGSDAYKGIPLWQSTDQGSSFLPLPTVSTNITDSDYPWLAVDDWPGTGQHDVYTVIKGYVGGTYAQWMTVSTNVAGNAWGSPLPLGDGSSYMPQMVVGTDHTAYVAWLEKGPTNLLRSCVVTNRGAAKGPSNTIHQLTASWVANDVWIRLLRSNTTTDTNDYFKAFQYPALAVNPDTSGTNRAKHLYVAYADHGTNANDHCDIFFVHSTDGGVTWDTSALRVNGDPGTNDQWMPTIVVKPDGNQLFIGWLDRRNDTNNSLIDAYGHWATIATNGAVTFFTTPSNDFRITTQSFPPVFAGTLDVNTNKGWYDPVWPPEGVRLDWWYEWWPYDPDLDWWDCTEDAYRNHCSEHNGAYADTNYVYFVWSDMRVRWTYYGANTNVQGVSRYQPDIRLARLPWPQP